MLLFRQCGVEKSHMGDVGSMAMNVDHTGEVVGQTRGNGPKTAEGAVGGGLEAASAVAVAPCRETVHGSRGKHSHECGPQCKGCRRIERNGPKPTEVSAGGGLEATSAPAVTHATGAWDCEGAGVVGEGG